MSLRFPALAGGFCTTQPHLESHAPCPPRLSSVGKGRAGCLQEVTTAGIKRVKAGARGGHVWSRVSGGKFCDAGQSPLRPQDGSWPTGPTTVTTLALCSPSTNRASRRQAAHSLRAHCLHPGIQLWSLRPETQQALPGAKCQASWSRHIRQGEGHHLLMPQARTPCVLRALTLQLHGVHGEGSSSSPCSADAEAQGGAGLPQDHVTGSSGNLLEPGLYSHAPTKVPGPRTQPSEDTTSVLASAAASASSRAPAETGVSQMTQCLGGRASSPGKCVKRPPPTGWPHPSSDRPLPGNTFPLHRANGPVIISER